MAVRFIDFAAFLAAPLDVLFAGLRPRELTRSWHSTKRVSPRKRCRPLGPSPRNEDFAATIIGYIRQLALGSPLVPYAERVDHALQRLRQKHQFTDPQRKWLDHIGTQMKHETVVDKQSLDQGRLKADGGFVRLNKVFDGKLESLLGELADEVWVDAG